MSYTTTGSNGLSYHHMGLPMSDTLGLNGYNGTVAIRNAKGDRLTVQPARGGGWQAVTKEQSRVRPRDRVAEFSGPNRDEVLSDAETWLLAR
ncbi:hypothetical protein L3Y25_gp098 [Gordonia phage Syleon]|uniref:Uncharacterized protein n=1 Tax=Gordonia phage Syleon TaxID=2653718 RepID=A0A5Q2WBM8_9CAUD|nr:hypothetical protein L3Y25_gp098 [Gordonia phage Syleon]QGH75866.1 hypothetical protein SEA_SYLEON_143 [Gordonia phage Syleon]